MKPITHIKPGYPAHLPQDTRSLLMDIDMAILYLRYAFFDDNLQKHNIKNLLLSFKERLLNSN